IGQGHQREKSRCCNMKKQSHSGEGKCWDNWFSVSALKQRNLEIMQQKQKSPSKPMKMRTRNGHLEEETQG
uniref:Uncharacterized protein n=1 Tax=Monodelphis domestica TaxID=13616 RepID=A0A5F8G9I9_MONDO